MENNKIDYLGDNKSFVSLVESSNIEPLLKVANVARITYNKTKAVADESDTKLAKFLWDHEHTSPYRHTFFTFHIKLPIFVARQLMKYQVGSTFRTYEINGGEVSLEMFDHFYDIDKGCSWNEVSGRYTQTSEDYYIPLKLRSNPPHGNKQSSGEYVNPLSTHDVKYSSEPDIIMLMDDISKNLLHEYKRLIANGVAKEIARMILPSSFYTECYWSMSLQSVLWFLHQRTKPEAQYEIRQLANAIKTLLNADLTRLGISEI
jgi:thymidylate synthase (FAD)